jgi:hypothetical protein
VRIKIATIRSVSPIRTSPKFDGFGQQQYHRRYLRLVGWYRDGDMEIPTDWVLGLAREPSLPGAESLRSRNCGTSSYRRTRTRPEPRNTPEGHNRTQDAYFVPHPSFKTLIEGGGVEISRMAHTLGAAFRQHPTHRPQSFDPRARSRLKAALMSARWVKACGKFPRNSPCTPVSSAYRPR